MSREEQITRMNERAAKVARLQDSARDLEQAARHARDLYTRVRGGSCYRCEGEQQIDTSREDGMIRMRPCDVCGGTGLWP